MNRRSITAEFVDEDEDGVEIVYEITFDAYPFVAATMIDPPEGGPDTASFRVIRDGAPVSYWQLPGRVQDDLWDRAVEACYEEE